MYYPSNQQPACPMRHNSPIRKHVEEDAEAHSTYETHTLNRHPPFSWQLPYHVSGSETHRKYHQGKRGKESHAVIRFAPEDETSHNKPCHDKYSADHHQVGGIEIAGEAQRPQLLQISRSKLTPILQVHLVRTYNMESSKVCRSTGKEDDQHYYDPNNPHPPCKHQETSLPTRAVC